jgi:hypothetical protein
LTQSENLAELISQIDFNSDPDDNKENSLNNDQIINNKMIKNDNENHRTLTADKFYRNIYDKVKLAYDEVCVLLDCIAISTDEKQLIKLETGREHLSIAQYNEDKPNEFTDKTLVLILKKRMIEEAKNLLKKSITKIKVDEEYCSNRFHLDLFKARQVWKIKKKGNKFIGDLGYRSVGCIDPFNQMRPNFEIIKNNKDTKKFIKVLIPEEYRGTAFINVKIEKTSNESMINPSKTNKKGTRKLKKQQFDSNFSLFSLPDCVMASRCKLPNKSDDPDNDSTQNNNNLSWHDSLERAQNVNYCKEIFNKLVRETFDPTIMNNTGFDFKPVVTGNSIRIMVISSLILLLFY